MASVYESYGTKNVFGNEVDGVFRNTYVVRNSRIKRTCGGVDPKGHAGALLADIDNLA